MSPDPKAYIVSRTQACITKPLDTITINEIEDPVCYSEPFVSCSTQQTANLATLTAVQTPNPEARSFDFGPAN